MKFTSPVYSAVSGSVAGLTYSHNAGGMYSRARAVPTNPNSTRQQIMRMYLDTVVTYWTETLSEAERESWRVYAANVPVMDKLGQTINLSGQQMFVRSGVPWLLAGKALSAIATGPSTFDTGDPGTLGLAGILASGNSGSIDVGGAPGWAADADGHIIIQSGNPQSPSINFYKGPFRFVVAVPGNATPITTAAFDTDDCTPPINWTVGQRGFIRVRCQYPDGRLTQAFIFDDLAA